MTPVLSVLSDPSRVSQLVVRVVKNSPLLLSALYWLIVIRLALVFTTQEAVRARFMPRSIERSPAFEDPDLVSWAVRRMAPVVPRALCLVQGLAVQIMLARRGIPAKLVLGVDLRAAKDLEAHAWVEIGGRVIIGGPKSRLTAYKRIAEFDPVSA